VGRYVAWFFTLLFPLSVIGYMWGAITHTMPVDVAAILLVTWPINFLISLVAFGSIVRKIRLY
jgi:hypothetical protein